VAVRPDQRFVNAFFDLLQICLHALPVVGNRQITEKVERMSTLVMSGKLNLILKYLRTKIDGLVFERDMEILKVL
jgi:hypothetical protein